MDDIANLFDRFRNIENKNRLNDTVCLLIFRNFDEKIGLKNFENVGWWFPFKMVDQEKTWNSVIEEILQPIGTPFKICGILQVCSIHYHPNFPAAKRVIFRVDVNQAIENSSDITWFSIHEIQEMSKTNLRGLHPLNFYNKFTQSPSFADYSELKSSDGVSNVREINIPKSSYDTLLESAGFTTESQAIVYYDFMSSVYPCETMNIHLFEKYIRSLNWHNEDKSPFFSPTIQLFRAFDTSRSGHLTHRDIVIGFAAMNISTQHGGPPAEIRCRYIFRFYDGNSDGILESSEFRSMVYDINKHKDNEMDEELFDATVTQHLKTFQLQSNGKVTLVNFLQTVGQLKFRGTSCLFRSPEQVISSILQNREWATSQQPVTPPYRKRRRNSNCAYQQPNGVNPERRYDLATHSVKVKRSGTLVDVNSLWDMEGTAAFGSTVRFSPKLRIERISSVDSFNMQSKANEMLKGLSYFEHCIKRESSNRTPKEAFSWGSTDRNALAHCLLIICRTAHDIINKEPRIIHVNAPAYVLGL